jgi:FADH2 O2-dependent halogenase
MTGTLLCAAGAFPYIPPLTKKGSRMRATKPFDVAILGAGLFGSISAAILARHGHRVVMLDEREHPRFTIGEATIPQTTMFLRLIADRFDVPEIRRFATFEGMHQYVTSHCGFKTNFGFVYQRERRAHDPREATQSVIPHRLVGYDAHWFRQDLDAYLAAVAVQYGATLRQRTRPERVDIDGRGVRLVTERGETFEARYVIDATAHKSALAHAFGLRETPTRFKTHSRALFNHFVKVPSYDAFADPRASWGVPQKWNDGTMHHLFDGGWIWVIPFGNHPESNSLLCSVGLTLDPRRFPKTDRDPQEEFDEIIGRFPGIAPQFANARPVREWVSTDRIQYSSKRCVGDRFCLTAQATGALDALFSRGMANSVEGLYILMQTLLPALKEDDLSAKRFELVERWQQRLLDYNDRLVNCSFISFRDFELWNAWWRVWSLGGLLNVFRIKKMQDVFEATRDVKVLAGLDEPPRHIGSLCPNLDWYESLFDGAASAVEAVERGELSSSVAAAKILTMFDRPDYVPPMFRMHDPARHFNCAFEATDIEELLAWGRTAAPPLRELCF